MIRNLFFNYVKYTAEEKLGIKKRREVKKLKNTIAYCRTTNEFNQAIKEERYKIIAIDELYYELYDKVKKSQNSNIEKNVGKLAMALGLIVPGAGMAVLAMTSGLIAFCHGKNNEIKVQYKVNIDSLNNEIIFDRK